jgi:hypothetical protein
MSEEEGQVSDGQINSEPEGGLVRVQSVLAADLLFNDQVRTNLIACRSLAKSRIMIALVLGRIYMTKLVKDLIPGTGPGGHRVQNVVDTAEAPGADMAEATRNDASKAGRMIDMIEAIMSKDHAISIAWHRLDVTTPSETCLQQHPSQEALAERGSSHLGITPAHRIKLQPIKRLRPPRCIRRSWKRCKS